MGVAYCAQPMGSEFFISHRDKDKMLSAIKALPERSVGPYALVSKHFRQIDNLEEMLLAWGFVPTCDATANIIGIQFVADTADEICMLFAIAPFVRAGSYLQFQSRDGYVWLWEFDGSICKETHTHSGLG